VDKRFKEIYIWSFILVAGVILLMLYTPIGGSFYNGNKQSYVELQPGVDFSKKITSSPSFRISTADNNNMPSIGVQPNKFNSSRRVVSGGNTVTSESFLQESAGTGGNFTTESSASLSNYSSGVSPGSSFQTSPYSGRNSNSSGSSGYGSLPLASTSEMSKISQNLGLSDNNETLNKAGNETTSNGASDPGGDPGDETVIPVGGSEIYLALIAFIYIFVKTKFFNKKTT